MSEYLPWPGVIRSCGYVAPERAVQLPMDVFKRLLDESPEDKHPAWKDDATGSGQENVLMLARTAYDLIGDDIPQWLLDEAREGR